MMMESNDRVLRNRWGREMHDHVTAGNGWRGWEMWLSALIASENPLPDAELTHSFWKRLVDTVEAQNEPGVFTTLHGFEWTSTYNAKNLHRVVIFRDDAEVVSPITPISQYDTYNPEELWEWLADYEESTGGRVLAIPHNGSMSNGRMFDSRTFDGRPIGKNYALNRQRWEPIYEVTQTKGDAEAHPLLSPTDEFADYYTWDKGDFGYQAKTPDMLPKEYARSALKEGLRFAAEIGANPFKFGMIGATGSHTSMSTPREDQYLRKYMSTEQAPGEGRHNRVALKDLQVPGVGRSRRVTACALYTSRN